jgi:hypothetical protein
MMEAARTSEMLVNFYQTTRRYNPEDSHLTTGSMSPGDSTLQAGHDSVLPNLICSKFIIIFPSHSTLFSSFEVESASLQNLMYYHQELMTPAVLQTLRRIQRIDYYLTCPFNEPNENMKMDLQNFEQVYHTEIDRNRSQLHEDIRN